MHMHKLMGNIHPELWPLKKWTIIIYFLSFSEISKTSTLVSRVIFSIPTGRKRQVSRLNWKNWSTSIRSKRRLWRTS